MKPMLNDQNGNAKAEVINAAFGLVEGVYGDEASLREWDKPRIQKAALKAAKTFIADCQQ